MAGYLYLAAHLLHDRLANTQAESAAGLVNFLVLRQVAKVDEKFIDLVCWDAHTEVLNVKYKVDVCGLALS